MPCKTNKVASGHENFSYRSEKFPRTLSSTRGGGSLDEGRSSTGSDVIRAAKSREMDQSPLRKIPTCLILD